MSVIPPAAHQITTCAGCRLAAGECQAKKLSALWAMLPSTTEWGGGSMDWNWWLFRVPFSRRVLAMVGPVVSLALIWAFFVGPFSDWTMKVIEDRLTARAERRADVVRDAFDLPSTGAPRTLHFAVPRNSAREVARELDDTGYAVHIRSQQGARWRVIVRGVPRNLVANMQDRVTAAAPRARLLP